MTDLDPGADSPGQVAANLAAVHRAVAEAARAAGRDPAEIAVIAVSKLQPPERIAAALAAGHRRFGENRVQEAKGRWAGLRERHPDLRLHLIGPLQTNKVRDAVELFDVIETVDRPRLAEALGRAMRTAGRRPDCLIQVNTGEEPQKAGVAPAGLDELMRVCTAEHDLPIRGLMCIPPEDEPPAPHFALLAELARRHGLPVISMGMSGDYEIAIRQGATQVRIGTAIFGERPPRAAAPGADPQPGG